MTIYAVSMLAIRRGETIAFHQVAVTRAESYGEALVTADKQCKRSFPINEYYGHSVLILEVEDNV